MLETVNAVSQTVSASGTINLGSSTIKDNANRMVLSNSNSIQINTPGKYKVTGCFNVYNSTGTPVTVDIQMYADGDAIPGTLFNATVPITGYEEIVIDKTIKVIPASYGNKANITFVSANGLTINNLIVDVYKRC